MTSSPVGVTIIIIFTQCYTAYRVPAGIMALKGQRSGHPHVGGWLLPGQVQEVETTCSVVLPVSAAVDVVLGESGRCPWGTSDVDRRVCFPTTLEFLRKEK